LRAKIVFLIAVVCIVVMTIVGCIDNFKTEEVPTFTPISTTVPTITPTIDKEAFIDKYTEAKEIFKYESYEPELKANESENLADMYYKRGLFDRSKDKYCEAAKFYSRAEEQDLKAKALFEEAYKIAPTEYYKEICRLYIDASQSHSKLMDYMSSAMNYMEKACDYYEKENYEAGEKERKKANEQIIRYNIEIESYNTLVEKIDEIEGW